MDLRKFGDWEPVLGARVWVDPRATVIGRVTLGDDVSLWPGAVLRGDVQRIEIGARTSIQDGSIVHVASARLGGGDGTPTVTGPDCTVGHGVILHACTIGRLCLVGMGAVLMDGVVAGDEVIVGAGSVVPPGRQLPSRTVWVGNPARQLRAVTDRELAQLRESAAHYVALKDRYLSGT